MGRPPVGGAVHFAVSWRSPTVTFVMAGAPGTVGSVMVSGVLHGLGPPGLMAAATMV
jgi:hypothetical protein